MTNTLFIKCCLNDCLHVRKWTKLSTCLLTSGAWRRLVNVTQFVTVTIAVNTIFICLLQIQMEIGKVF